MTFDDYQHAATRTMNAGLSHEERLMDAAAGLSEEAGEVLGLVRKHLYMGYPLDLERITKELGDAFWCVAAVATCIGVRLDDIAAANAEKLRQRYPDGYSDEASRRNRPIAAGHAGVPYVVKATQRLMTFAS